MDIRHHRFESGEPDEGQHLAQPVELHHRRDARAEVGPAPRGVGQPARVEVRVDGHVVPEPLGRPEQRFQLDLLDGPVAGLAALHRTNRFQNLVGLKWRERLGDLGLLPDDGEVRRIVHDLEVVPEVADDALDRRPAIREGKRAHDLGKVRVGGGADEQSARVVAVFVGVDTEPRPGAAAGAERVLVELRRFVERSSLAAFATHEQVGEVPGRADFFEPELAPAAVLGSMDEPCPVDVIHVPSRTGTHEADGHHGEAVEAPSLIQSLAVHQAPPTLRPVVASGFLHHEPLGKSPCPNTPGGRPRLVRLRRRRIEPRRRHTGHRPELAGQPRLHDLVEASRVRPGVEPADDRRVSGQVNEGARSVGRDHLALADLTVTLAAHASPSTCRPVRSRRKRSTTGSTSRSDRLARNFL